MVLSVPADSSPRPAATVLVLRSGPAGPEVFMVRRQEGAAFGGADVFPGGRVDASDAAADRGWCDGLEHAARQLAEIPLDDALAHHVAAARELFEEAGVLLARTRSGGFVSLAGAADHSRFTQYRRDVHSSATTFRDIIEREGLSLALDALVLYAYWVTPPVDARRFATRFFVTRLPPGQTPAHDEVETTDGRWISAPAALDAGARGDIVLPPPTWTTLRELERFGSVDQAIEWARRRTVRRREPTLWQRDGERMLLMPGDPLHPDAGAEPGETGEGIETRFVWSAGRWRPSREGIER